MCLNYKKINKWSVFILNILTPIEYIQIVRLRIHKIILKVSLRTCLYFFNISL
jgi:hypothetical protein